MGWPTAPRDSRRNGANTEHRTRHYTASKTHDREQRGHQSEKLRDRMEEGNVTLQPLPQASGAGFSRPARSEKQKKSHYREESNSENWQEEKETKEEEERGSRLKSKMPQTVTHPFIRLLYHSRAPTPRRTSSNSIITVTTMEAVPARTTTVRTLFNSVSEFLVQIITYVHLSLSSRCCWPQIHIDTRTSQVSIFTPTQID